MNIGIVTTWSERGAAHVSRLYAIALKHFGHSVHIYSRGGEEFDPNFFLDIDTITRDNSTNLFTPDYINKRKFTSWASKNKIDAIIFNEQRWLCPVVWARRLGIVAICYADYYRLDTVDDFAIYDLIICNTLRHYSVFKKFNNAVYMKWGCRPGDYKIATGSSNSVRMFHSAGVSPQRKGTFNLLKAFLSIGSQYENLSLTIHLQKHDQKYLVNRLTDIEVVKFNKLIDKNLYILKDVKYDENVYQEYDMYVYPSLLDGLGLSPYEASAAGLQLIATNEPPMNELNLPFSTFISVDRRISREDGYYWPLSISEPSDIESAIFKALEIYKYENRIDIHNYFKENYDIIKNFEVVNLQLNSIKNISIDFENSVYKKYSERTSLIRKILRLMF